MQVNKPQAKWIDVACYQIFGISLTTVGAWLLCPVDLPGFKLWSRTHRISRRLGFFILKRLGVYETGLKAAKEILRCEVLPLLDLDTNPPKWRN